MTNRNQKQKNTFFKGIRYIDNLYVNLKCYSVEKTEEDFKKKEYPYIQKKMTQTL